MKSDGSTGHGAEAVQTYHRALTFTREPERLEAGRG